MAGPAGRHAKRNQRQRCQQIKDTKIGVLFVLMGNVHGLDVRVIKMTSSQNRYQNLSTKIYLTHSNEHRQERAISLLAMLRSTPKTKEHRYSSISTLSTKEAALLIDNNNETACTMLSLDRHRHIFSGRILSPW